MGCAGCTPGQNYSSRIDPEHWIIRNTAYPTRPTLSRLEWGRKLCGDATARLRHNRVGGAFLTKDLPRVVARCVVGEGAELLDEGGERPAGDVLEENIEQVVAFVGATPSRSNGKSKVDRENNNKIPPRQCVK